MSAGNPLLASLDAFALVTDKLVELRAADLIAPCHDYPEYEVDLIGHWNRLCETAPENISIDENRSIIIALGTSLGRQAMDLFADMRDVDLDTDSPQAVEKFEKEISAILESGRFGHDDHFPMRTLGHSPAGGKEKLSIRFENWKPTVYRPAGDFSWVPLETSAPSPETPDEARP